MLYNIFVSFTGFDICLAKTYNNITEIARCLGTSSSSLKLYSRCKMAVTSSKVLWLFFVFTANKHYECPTSEYFYRIKRDDEGRLFFNYYLIS